MFLVFATKEEAIKADQQIALNHNMSGGTTRFSQEIELVDGRFALPMPAQVVLRHEPVPNAFGGFNRITETRDPCCDVIGYVLAETIEAKPVPAPVMEPAPEPTPTTV